MPPRPATLSAADLNRVLRVARKHGARAVKLSFPSGETAEIQLADGGNSGDKSTVKVERKAPIRLG
jgi:hypothetical protein